MTVGLKRVDHVSMAVWKIDDTLAFFTDVFGWKEAGRFSNEEAGFAGVVLAKCLRERGPGLHHVTLQVNDADAAADGLREHSIEPFGGPRVSYDWKEMFVHPKASGGVLFQLFEQLPEPQPGDAPSH